MGGFELRKWLSNEKSLLTSLSPDLLAAEPSSLFNDGSSFVNVGSQWWPANDSFQFNITNEKAPNKWTKRLIASEVAKLFDPLGLLEPATITAKLFLQKLWLLKLGWDDPLPDDELRNRNIWVGELPLLTHLEIPRWLGYAASCESLQIHGFADANKLAYGAVLYLRTETHSSISTQLIVAKSKVAPLKVLSIPRLELSAAVLLAKLVIVKLVLPPFASDKTEVILWSDSTDVLHWLEEHPSKWPTFIANRGSAIHTLVTTATWKHVKGEENPAIVVSRGLKPSELSSSRLWWAGPEWLTQEESSCPSTLLETSSSPKLTCFNVVNIQHQHSAKQKPHLKLSEKGLWQLLEKRSTLLSLLKATAFVLRVIDRYRETMPAKEQDKSTSAIRQKWFENERDYS